MIPNRHNDPSPRLARLFGIAAGEYLGWDEDELNSALLSQLAAPLENWLGARSRGCQSFTSDASASGSDRLISLSDLLHHPNPPLSVLRRAKELAKLADVRLKAPLPAPVATAIYFSTIAVALVKCGHRITEMNDEQIRRGFRWVADQIWIESSLKSFTRSALAALDKDE